MSITTSISLDPETEALAHRMKREGKNFSKFVRECLHLYYREESGDHMGRRIEWAECDPFCHPSRTHYCRVCWPAGTPSLDSLAAANAHVTQVKNARALGSANTVDQDCLIPSLWRRDDVGTFHLTLEQGVLDWLREEAENHNRFIMPLADLDLKGNAKPVKAEKVKVGLIRRLFREIGR